MCLFDYETEQGNVRAFTILTTTSSGGGYYESLGTNGTLVMSEREAYTKIYKESGADNEAQWNAAIQRGLLKSRAGTAAGGADAIASYESAPPDEYVTRGI